MASSSNDNLFWIIIILFDCLVYGLCCLLIVKRKSITYISIRSPTLLLLTNFSNFIISISLILFKITKSNFFSIIFYTFRFTMIVAILIRYERILACFRINISKFYNKRYLLQEKFYVRISLFSLIICFLFILIMNIIFKNCFEIFNLSHKPDNNNIRPQMYIWVMWNFIEQALIITYIFRILNKKLKYYLFFELCFIFVINFFISNYSTGIYVNDRKSDNSDFVIIHLIGLYIYLILNGLFPTIMSFCSPVSISYNFTPKLITNLYLFLTNEDCYKSFNDYLSEKGNNGCFYLKLYTHIMKYKLDMALNPDKALGQSEANEIFNTYFNSETYSQQIDQVIMQNVREKCQMLNYNTFNRGIFDDALQYVFDELNKRFIDYKNSEAFYDLFNEINLYSFIQCKMCNIGLINKF